MGRITAFDFTNRPTFLFFKWVTENREQEPAALIAAAFEAVESEPGYQADGDVSLGVRDVLAKLLDTALQEVLDRSGELIVGDVRGVKAPVGAWLAFSLLHEAGGHIDTTCTAEALLVDAGKWAPECEVSGHFPLTGEPPAAPPEAE